VGRAEHAEGLKLILGGLKGPLMKVAQFLSTVPDALPAVHASNSGSRSTPWAKRMSPCASAKHPSREIELKTKSLCTMGLSSP
jgi:hypothetical protein